MTDQRDVLRKCAEWFRNTHPVDAGGADILREMLDMIEAALSAPEDGRKDISSGAFDNTHEAQWVALLEACAMLEEHGHADAASLIETLANRAASAPLTSDGYARGFYAAADKLTHKINTLDSEHMTGKQVRSAIYSECLELRPLPPPPNPQGVK